MNRWVTALVLLVALTGCDDFFYVCPVADDRLVGQLPEKLSATGLYEDIAADRIAADVVPYTPEFSLWADGADKRRFLQIPAGAVIDTSNMDAWQFPEGTRVWKEFSRDGVRLETRLLQKVGPTDAEWASLAYVWNDDDSDAIASPTGFVDTRGTSHNVPGAGECVGCHGGRPSFVLGVSAIQLSFAREPGVLDLVDLNDLGLLSDSAPAPFDVPGDDDEHAALGYLHANCGHCHNQTRPGDDIAKCMDPNNSLDFFLSVGSLDAVEDTATFRTARRNGSSMLDRAASRRLFFRMPPLGSELVDREGLAVLRRWIEGLD